MADPKATRDRLLAAARDRARPKGAGEAAEAIEDLRGTGLTGVNLGRAMHGDKKLRRSVARQAARGDSLGGDDV